MVYRMISGIPRSSRHAPRTRSDVLSPEASNALYSLVRHVKPQSYHICVQRPRQGCSSSVVGAQPLARSQAHVLPLLLSSARTPATVHTVIRYYIVPNTKPTRLARTGSPQREHVIRSPATWQHRYDHVVCKPHIHRQLQRCL